MTLQNQTEIDIVLNDACKHFVYSGYQLYSVCGASTLNKFGGMTSYWDKSEPVSSETHFDLGSLTKVILTTSIYARLVDRREIDLKDTLANYLPQFKNSKYGCISLELLLSHSSGLLAWFPFYLERKSLVDIFLERETEFVQIDPGKKAVYSDLGFLLLGEVLKAKGLELENSLNREVLSPLNLKNIHFGGNSLVQYAATEYCLHRKKVLDGEVFDLNTAWLGGVSSHAGLFASARDLGAWVSEWLKAVEGKSSWLSQKTALLFTNRSELAPKSSWALGWDTKSAAFSSAGELFSRSSFGHLGFPGTSIWVDAARKGYAIFLSNRVHPSRFDERIKKVRPLVHDEIVKFWERSQ